MKTRFLQYFFPIIAILTLDQFLKRLVYLRLTVGESIPIIRDILHITFVKNTGAAFGLFKKGTLIFIIISIVAVLFISILIYKEIKTRRFSVKPVFNIGLILVISGALGNLIDRIRFGYVIDFIDVRIWPVFNIADSVITVGTVLLILSLMGKRQH